MRFLRRMRVASRLAVGFGVLAVALVAVGLFGLSRVSRVNHELDRMSSFRLANLEDIAGMIQVTHENSRWRMQSFVETDPAAVARLVENQKKNSLRNNQLQKKIEERLAKDVGDEDESVEEDRELFEAVGKERPALIAIRDRMNAAFNGGNRELAVQILGGEMDEAQTAYNKALEGFRDHQAEELHEAAEEGAELTSAARRWTIIIIVLALLVAVAIGVIITQSITRPLVAAVQDAGKVAEGRFVMESKDEMGQVSEAFAFVHGVLHETVELKDRVQRENNELQTNIMDLLTVVADASEGNLTVRAKVTAGALGNVSDAFNSLLEALQGLMSRVARQIEQTNRTVNQVSQSSTQMADGASTQASEVKAAKALVEKSSEDIKRMGQAADSAADAARNTESSASEGAAAIENIVSGMEQLRQNVQAGAKKMKNLGDRSMEITGIVDTISRISEQTNMLALNAAIEAARAGEHGRGFSVVAEEVRKLAERTATATQEIAKLVTAIHHETTETVAAIEKQTQVVEQESALVSRAGKALVKIREVSSQSAALVKGISTLTKSQIEGSTVVGKAITQISQIAQATLQGAEGTVSTLDQLHRLSAELTQSISRFKVN